MRAQRLSGGLALPQVKRVVARWLNGPALSPRLALLAVGTLLQTIALTASLAVDMGQGASPAALLVVVPFALAIAAFVVAALPDVDSATAHIVRRPAYQLATVPLLVALALAVVWTGFLVTDLVTRSAFDPRVYASDDAAFIHYDAELVTRGVNPYTADALYWNALQRFPTVGATPLRRGTYASLTWAPRYAQIRRDVAQEIADPTTRQGEFAPASLHSYPALAFLSYVPVVWAGLGSTLLLSLVIVALLLVVIGRTVPSSIRALGWALLLANSVGILLTLRGSFEALALIPAMLAWQMMDRRRLSPTLLGLACAVKQIIWPLAVLYVVLCIRREGWRAAFARGGLVLLAFLAPNLPFALANPAAWAKSLFLPVSLPLFPDGVGLVAMARAGILSLWPPQVYTALEVLALGALVLWLIVARRTPRPELVLLLGTLPLALGWRSLATYFAFLPALALYAASPLLAEERFER